MTQQPPAHLDILAPDLPGAEFVRDGLADQAAGRETISSLLVEIAAPRLLGVGVPVPAASPASLAAEIRLHRLLQREHGADAFSQYNALLRRLGKLLHALDLRGPRNPPRKV